MDKRTAIPVSLPHPNPTTSYWQDPPDVEIADYASASTLPGEVVDTVIVGSGITGAGVAWGLLGGGDQADGTNGRAEGKERVPRVVMLEARRACSGATGRNGTSSS